MLRLTLDKSLVCVAIDGVDVDDPIASSLGKSVVDLLAPDDRGVLETLGEAVAFHRSARAEVILVVGGERVPGLLELDTGQPDSHAGVSNETVPTGGEAALISGEAARFRALAEHARDSICEIGDEGRILYANASHAEMLGAPGHDFTGVDPLDHVHADDRPRASYLFRPGARTRRKGALVYRALSLRGHAIHLESRASAYTGHDGRERIVVTTRDVTEREHARETLDRQIRLESRVAELSRYFLALEVGAVGEGVESRLAEVAELAEAEHAWMISLSTGGKGAERFDWWQEGLSVPRHAPSPGGRTDFAYSTCLIRAGAVYHVPDIDALPEEAAGERADMRARGVRSMLGIPIMSGGAFVGCLGFESFQRETNWPDEIIVLLRMAGEIFLSSLRRRQSAHALRDSQAQLLQAQKMEAVGTLAGGIAHDFNNHLAVMLANARFVRQELDGPSDLIDAVADFERSADHCAQLTRSLLAFSRRSPGEAEPVLVAEVVGGVEDLVRPLLPGNIEFGVTLMPKVGRIAVDRVQIQQVLVNLLVNARDAMSEGGPIRLDALRRSLEPLEARALDLNPHREFVVLVVEDRGAGMDAETLARVFEPFFTTKAVGRGTGLGLAMAYGIVRESGGAIDVESQPGQGTIFRVFLPSHGESPVDLG